jgi:hypothetical protein
MHVKSGTCLSLIAACITFTQVVARPTRRFLENVDLTNEVLVFDAPAFQDPQDPTSFKAAIPAFVSLRQFNFNPTIADGFSTILSSSGVQVGDQFENLANRVTLFGAVGLPGKQVSLKIDGCGDEVRYGHTCTQL